MSLTIQNVNLCKRVISAAALTLLTGTLIAYTTVINGANYRPPTERNAQLSGETPVGAVSSLEEPAEARHVITMHFVGNCIIGSMLGSSGYGTFNEAVLTEGPAYFLANAASVLQEDDWTFAALGTVLSDRDLKPTDKTDGEKTWYLGPAANAAVLAEGGVDIVSVATDHTMDYGAEGYADTKAALESAALTWGDDSGAVYLEKYGVQIGVYLCSMTSMEADLPRLRSWVEAASETCDLVIVYPHGNPDGLTSADPALLDAYRSLLDSGADLVLGSHAKTVSDITETENGLIIPSLGSFLSGDNLFPETETMIFRLEVFCGEMGMESWQWKTLPYLSYVGPWQPAPKTE